MALVGHIVAHCSADREHGPRKIIRQWQLLMTARISHMQAALSLPTLIFALLALGLFD